MSIYQPGTIVQLVVSLTVDPEITSLIPAWSREIISTVILLLSLIKKYVHKVLVNWLVKLAWEKVWLGELTIPT